MEDAVGLIKKFNPNAFYTVEDIRYVSEGVFPTVAGQRPGIPGFWGRWRGRFR